MFRKLVGALVVMTLAVGVAMAEDFTAYITKVEGTKITYQKYKKKDKEGDPVTIEVAKDAKVAYAKVTGKGKDAKYDAGDAVEGGLKAELFSKGGDKGVQARITPDADNKTVTQILIIGKKK
jgi:hypothetical protein